MNSSNESSLREVWHFSQLAYRKGCGGCTLDWGSGLIPVSGERELPNAGDPGSVSGGGTRSHMPVTKCLQAARMTEDPAHHS